MAKVHIHHLTEVRELELVRSPKHLTLKLKFTKVCVIKLLVTEYSAVLENVWKEIFSERDSRSVHHFDPD